MQFLPGVIKMLHDSIKIADMCASALCDLHCVYFVFCFNCALNYVWVVHVKSPCAGTFLIMCESQTLKSAQPYKHINIKTQHVQKKTLQPIKHLDVPHKMVLDCKQWTLTHKLFVCLFWGNSGSHQYIKFSFSLEYVLRLSLFIRALSNHHHHPPPPSSKVTVLWQTATSNQLPTRRKLQCCHQYHACSISSNDLMIEHWCVFTQYHLFNDWQI